MGIVRVKCLWCDDIIFNNKLHNMTFCKCGKTALDYHPHWSRVAYTSDGDNNDETMFEIIECDS